MFRDVGKRLSLCKWVGCAEPCCLCAARSRTRVCGVRTGACVPTGLWLKMQMELGTRMNLGSTFRKYSY